MDLRSWRDGSAVKSTDCSSKDPEFKSQQPHGGSQPSVMGSDALFWCVWIQLQCTHINKSLKKYLENQKIYLTFLFRKCLRHWILVWLVGLFCCSADFVWIFVQSYDLSFLYFSWDQSIPSRIFCKAALVVINFFRLLRFMYVSTLSLSSKKGIRSHYRWLWATMWLLGIELRTSGRAVSALNRWAISPAPVIKF